MTKKRDQAAPDDAPREQAPDGAGSNFNYLGEDIRRVGIGLAVCGGVLLLLKLSGLV